MARFWWWLFLAAATPTLFGQSAGLDRLVAESARIRALIKTDGEEESTDLKSLLRDCIETHLPENGTELDAEFPSLEARLTADLRRAGLWKPEKSTADFRVPCFAQAFAAGQLPGRTNGPSRGGRRVWHRYIALSLPLHRNGPRARSGNKWHAQVGERVP